MIKVKVEFSVGTAYLKSTVKEIVEVEVWDVDTSLGRDAIETAVNEEIEEAYDEWMWNKIHTGKKEISREVIEEDE